MTAETWHGTYAGYQHRRCRCDPCFAAGRAWREKRKAREITGEERWHGTITGYNSHACRCDRCQKARRDFRAERAARPRTGDEPWHGTSVGWSTWDCKCERCAEHRRIHKRAKKYGITYERLTQMLAVGRCAICSTTEPGGNGWSIDHDHSCCDTEQVCGRCVRGLLCHHCNVLIGYAREDRDVLASAIRYLDEWKQ